MSDNGRRKALVKTKRALLTKDIGGDSEGVGGANRGDRLAVELKASLCQVYWEGRRLRHHGGEGGQ